MKAKLVYLVYHRTNNSLVHDISVRYRSNFTLKRSVRSLVLNDMYSVMWVLHMGAETPSGQEGGCVIFLKNNR